MKARSAGVVAAVLAAVILWRVTPHTAQVRASAPSTEPSRQSPASHAPRSAAQSLVPDVGSTTMPGESSVLPSGAATPQAPEPSPGLTPSIVLENTRYVFRQYCSRFGGNPVGTNPEITRALAGANPAGVDFINPEDGLRINDRGELIDNWGTPFFFHQLSGTLMEIHSAGPDRKMWTGDDLVLR